MPSTPPAAVPPTPSRHSSSGPSSFFTAGKLFGSSTPQPDPDRDDIVWHEPEPYSAVISRKEHPRDPTSILSIREVLRHKSPALADHSTSGTLSPTPGSTESQLMALASVYAKPDVGVSMQAAGGEVISGTTTVAESAGKILHEIGVASEGRSQELLNEVQKSSHLGSGVGQNMKVEPTDVSKNPTMDDIQRSGSPFSDQLSTTGSSYVDTHIRRGKAESILSFGESEVNVEGGSGIKKAPTPPPKDEKQKGKGVERTSGVGTMSMKELPAPPVTSSTIHQPTPSTSSFTGTIANSLNMAMRFVLPESSRPPSAHPTPPAAAPPPPVPKKPHHNLLLVDMNNIDERPHIKYDWTIGKRLKFSCTVYYAKQFELMRKKCGIDDTFLKSLERSFNWVAVGGKSKSNFWKTGDEKFIIKTLVNAWNVADL